MNRIKNLISKVSIDVKELAKRFPITMILIILTTFIFTISVDNDFSRSIVENFEKIAVFLMIFGVGSFFTETFFNEKNKKIISYILSGGISIIFTHLIFSEFLENEIIVYRFLAVYIITLFFITIYKTIKKEDLKFHEYLINVFRDLLNYTITYGILAIGITFICIIFIELILDGEYGSFLLKSHVLLFGLFYVLSILYSLSNINKKEINSFTKGLVLYVLMPLIMVAMLIIYMYIAKILLLRNIPKNIIYRILAGLFVFAFPIWNMASNYEQDNKTIKKIVKILPYLYIPFIFLETYSISIRINEYGITPLRYFSCAIILFQIIALVLNIYKNKEKLDLLLIVGTVFSIVLLITPLNYENISNLSQKNRIEKYLKENMSFNSLSEIEKKRVKGAYRYLKNEKNGEKYIPSYLSEDNIKQIENYSLSQYEYQEKYKFLDFYDGLDLLISDYNKIEKVSGYCGDGTILKLDGKNIKVDFSDLIKIIIEKNKIDEEIAENYFKNNNIININEKQDIYVEEFDIDFKDENNINYFTIKGYLLEK